MNIFALLNELLLKDGLKFLMIGGHAVNAYGYSRLTHDLDILVNRDDRAKWLAALQAAGFALQHDGGGFLRFTAAEGDQWPLDLMLATPPTFSKMLAASQEIQQGEFRVRIPSLDHLFVLKLHALKAGEKARQFKDFMDILSLVQVNKVEVGSDSFRQLCEQYGGKEIYGRILAFQ